MQRVIYLFLLCAISCTSASETPDSHDNPPFILPVSDIDTAKLGIRLHPMGTYEHAKLAVQKMRTQGKTSGNDFEEFMLNTIIPFWYGTEWDFNGYTAVPNKGEIACGYFVSTTLLHAGININRYHLAQQAGLNEAKSLALSDEYWKWISGKAALEEALNSYADGLYFVGLDNHVGFLLIRGGGYYFIHSNYIEDRVMIEEALTAPAFQSDIYVVAELSTNPLFLEKWRTGGTFSVIRN